MAPLQDAIHISPHLMSAVLALLLLYSKLSGMYSNKNKMRYTFLGLSTLPALVSTHLFLSLGAGLFFVGMYLADKTWTGAIRVFSQKRIREYALPMLCLATIVTSMFLDVLFFIPLLAFILGAYMSNVLGWFKARSKYGNYFLFMTVIPLMLLFLLPRSANSLDLYSVLFYHIVNVIKFTVSFLCGFYISIKPKTNLINTNKGQQEQSDFFYDKVKAPLQKLPLLTLVFISTLLWWMLRSPETFSDFAHTYL